MNISLESIKLLQKSRIVQLTFTDGKSFELSCEYLRIFSPSAAAKAERKKDLVRRESINIIAIEPVGQYAVKLVFNDGHDSGIYSFETLYDLAVNHDENWKGVV